MEQPASDFHLTVISLIRPPRHVVHTHQENANRVMYIMYS